ncbi:MAG TPA: formylmethanofuran dehydrogenase subunit C [Methanospirillum sp.]|uniref:formylmethanofuran dehydrogenase subunit C n=1 Tax=Methanospirillum sp. TaxID=45200 RepID=UPI002B77EDD1|nr:formylmethanofuran dehydrogenase subunit C [Methanospirillum sp.]HWQ64908.1 formylmethanofuran dehydrogenase subunit C [Methanospirillum sp.]
MKTVTIKMVKVPELYLEGDMITPDQFAGKTNEEIAALRCYEGRETYKLGDFFEIHGDAVGATPEETKVIVTGDCKKVKYIGMNMTAGEVVVESSCDMYTGGWMKGGKLHIKGNVDSFSGLGMEGGEFIVDGNGGNFIGASYRGDWRGMQGGVLRVKGNVGSDIGTFMNGGTLIVEGDADVHIGTHQEGGTIIVKGNVNRRVGGQMVKGTIYVYGTINYMMPGFKYNQDVELEVDGDKAVFSEYLGDLGERHSKSKGQVVYGKLYQKKN